MNKKSTSINKLNVLKRILRRHNKEIINLKKDVAELKSFKQQMITLLESTEIESIK